MIIKNMINMFGRFFSRPSPPFSSSSPPSSSGPRSSGTESSDVNLKCQKSEKDLKWTWFEVNLISKEWNKLECLKKWCPESHTEEELVQADSILPQATGPYGQLVPQSTGPSSQLVLPVNWSFQSTGPIIKLKTPELLQKRMTCEQIIVKRECLSCTPVSAWTAVMSSLSSFTGLFI